MSAYHPDFVFIPTASTYGEKGNTATIHHMIWEGLQVREEMAEYSAETRAILDDMCASVAHIVDDIAGDLGDFAADLDEMI